jgi:ferritin-like metal-binding protein YciE
MSYQTNSTQLDGGEADRHTVATYLSDMLALERHIAAPIESQLNSEDHQAFSDAFAIIARIQQCAADHIEDLDAQLEAAGGDPGSGIKSAWSQFLGAGASALNQARKTKVSKSLRDDSTALALAAISYTMLHATASGLGDFATASLAKRHLDDYAPIVVDISKVMPSVVLSELSQDGVDVVVSAADLTREATSDSWNSKA